MLGTFIRRVRLTQIPAQLKKRQIVLSKLAEKFEPERAYTERALGTLRLLLPDPGVVWLKRGPVADALLAAWVEERKRGRDERLALLRALHRAQPAVWWLPPRGVE